ncbi:MAG: hypothetical protein E7190_11685 [Erysipelotrichaceae bacterium]|nr:hypothetical protein [Erysipelotrichaceae bacterium]
MNIPSPITLVLAAGCSALLAILMRLFTKADGSRYGMILGNYLTCTLTGFFLIPDKSILLSAQKATYLSGIAGGFLFVLSLVCMHSSISENGAILTSAFSKLGLLVPLALSIFLFHEMPSMVQIIGLLAVFAAFAVMNHTSPDNHARQFSLFSLLIVLLTNGLSDAMAKIYNAIGVQREDTVYMFLVFLSAACLTFFLLWYDAQRTGRKTQLKDLVPGIAIGIPNYFSSIFLLASLRTIPSFIAYPVFSAGTILIVTAAGILLFHERLSSHQSLGLLLILVSLVLLNI